MDIRPSMLIANQTLTQVFGSQKNQTAHNIDEFENLLKEPNIKQVDRVKTLEQWIASLEELKTNLEQEITRDNLSTYKEGIKRFLGYYVENDIYLKEFQTRDGMFYSKNIQVIKAVDENIDKLTENLLKTQMGKLEMLHLVGEVQGLLFELIV